MRALLTALIIIITTQAVSAEGMCKTLEEGRTVPFQREVEAKDWSCDGSNPYIGTKIEVFNHTSSNINKIVLQGDKSWGKSTNILPQTSQTFRINNSSWCGDKNLKLKLFYTVYFQIKDKCTEYYSAKELREKKQAEERKEAQAIKQRIKQSVLNEITSQIKAEQNKIRDNCVISKGKNAGEAVMQEIRRICTDISKNPSMVQKFRWGS